METSCDAPALSEQRRLLAGILGPGLLVAKVGFVIGMQRALRAFEQPRDRQQLQARILLAVGAFVKPGRRRFGGHGLGRGGEGDEQADVRPVARQRGDQIP
jgi:hypothetical protein